MRCCSYTRETGTRDGFGAVGARAVDFSTFSPFTCENRCIRAGKEEGRRMTEEWEIEGVIDTPKTTYVLRMTLGYGYG